MQANAQERAYLIILYIYIIGQGNARERAGRVVGQFQNAGEKTLNHQGHEVSRRLLVSSISFVYLRVLGGSRFRKVAHYRWPDFMCFRNGPEHFIRNTRNRDADLIQPQAFYFCFAMIFSLILL